MAYAGVAIPRDSMTAPIERSVFIRELQETNDVTAALGSKRCAISLQL
jgi:hypothetical protein